VKIQPQWVVTPGKQTNKLNTLKTKINLHFVYIHLLLLKERGVLRLPRSVGKCCFRDVIAVGIVRTVRNSYVHCVAVGTSFGLMCVCIYDGGNVIFDTQSEESVNMHALECIFLPVRFC